ncbi:hypothetical protein [Nocardia asiatica]|uniref:hypothetical protein n=1 Tax=Nocardia asiatica TaxID=209252 RepID=UPI0002E1F2C3|nr:hypothetical protein [Nocardia asiatica]
MTATRDQLATETERQATAVLAVALMELCSRGTLDETEQLVRGVIIETLYDRHPEVAAAYNAWIDDLESDATAESVVIAAALSL